MMMSTSSSIVIPSTFIGTNVYGDYVNLPYLGAGTWQYNDTTAYQSICKALQNGYTLIDTAFGYGNEKGVGMAIRDCWDGRREDLFVMTKIPGGLNTTQVWAAHKQNLFNLGLDYVDHLMVHYPSDWDQKYASVQHRQEEWLALEGIYNIGEAYTIGISHYCEHHIHDILNVATIKPSINQVEYHIGSQDIDNVIEFCKLHDITFMSFSPLCGPCTYDPIDSLINGQLVQHVAKTIMEKYKTNNNITKHITGSQVALRYIIQQGIPVIPKSNTLEHIKSNQEIFNFYIENEEMNQLLSAIKPPAEGGDCDVP